MSQNRLARRRRAALMRRARPPLVLPASAEMLPYGMRTFTVGDRTICSIVLDDDDSADESVSSDSGHECPLCRAIATLEEYQAACAEDRATPDLEQRANEAMALLSSGVSCEEAATSGARGRPDGS